jgi:endo-1,4-beta-xylanase
MRTNFKSSFGALMIAAVMLVALLALSLPARGAGDSDSETLRQYADKLGFGIGNVIQGRFWNRLPQFKPILSREYNRAFTIVTMRQTQPERGHFDFDGMDQASQFARDHNMKLFGVALVYRNDSSPDWLHFNSLLCGGYSAQELDQILKEQIETLVRHGGNDYYAWEVVNEPLAPGHNGCWGRVLGQDNMIAKAFQYAHEANPNVTLLLNDTFGQSGVDKEKTDEFFELIARVRKLGAQIDAVGCQMHLEEQQLHPDYVDEFKYFLTQARKAGVQVQITEMDVYQGPPGAVQDPYVKQKEVFYNIVHTCLKDSNCTAVTIFGMNDDLTWLRTNKDLFDANPVLFDGQYNKKPAYYGVLDALKEGR